MSQDHVVGDPEFGDDDSLLVEDQRFSVVNEWVIDADLSDAAFRVYATLLRYGNGTGRRMPSRGTLARRLYRSTDSIDRAVKELVSAGIVRVERRHNGVHFLNNRYYVRTSEPPAGQTPRSRGSRKNAATPSEVLGGGRKSAATPGRTSAATVAANLRPDRKKLTERTPPPPPPSPPLSVRPTLAVEEAEHALLVECGIENLDELATRCVAARRSLGLSATRWAAPCLLAAIQLAVRARHWPPDLVVPALLAVAADPVSQSPVRLAEAGPWWDVSPTAAHIEVDDPEELAALEARLDETEGLRPRLQAQARAELASEHLPVTRSTVTRRACELLDRRRAG